MLLPNSTAVLCFRLLWALGPLTLFCGARCRLRELLFFASMAICNVLLSQASSSRCCFRGPTPQGPPSPRGPHGPLYIRGQGWSVSAEFSRFSTPLRVKFFHCADVAWCVAGHRHSACSPGARGSPPARSSASSGLPHLGASLQSLPMDHVFLLR